MPKGAGEGEGVGEGGAEAFTMASDLQLKSIFRSVTHQKA